MRALACALAAALAVPALAADAPRMKGGAFEPARDAAEFTLSGSDGKPLRLASLRGKVVLMAFGFTSCPAVCPTTLAMLADARRSLGGDADAVQVVFVTVDPARDDPARLKAYLAAFDPSFVGATGSEPALADVRKRYGVQAAKVQTAGGYAVDHSSSVFLIDRQGRLRGLMPYGRSARDLVHDVKLLLAS